MGDYCWDENNERQKSLSMTLGNFRPIGDILRATSEVLKVMKVPAANILKTAANEMAARLASEIYSYWGWGKPWPDPSGISLKPLESYVTVTIF